MARRIFALLLAACLLSTGHAVHDEGHQHSAAHGDGHQAAEDAPEEEHHVAAADDDAVEVEMPEASGMASGMTSVVTMAMGAALLLCCSSCCCAGCTRTNAAEQLDVEVAAQKLFETWKDSPQSTAELPEKLQGVFWMEDNPAPELLVTISDGVLNPNTRVLTKTLGGPYGWSYNNSATGWIEYYLVVWLGATFCTRMIFEFNEDYTVGEIPLYILGCIRINTGYFMIQDPQDPNLWARDTFDLTVAYGCKKYNDPGVKPGGTYQLRRIIDGKGNRLPAYQDMLDSLGKAPHYKTRIQVVQGFRKGCCGCCADKPPTVGGP